MPYLSSCSLDQNQESFIGVTSVMVIESPRAESDALTRPFSQAVVAVPLANHDFWLCLFMSSNVANTKISDQNASTSA